MKIAIFASGTGSNFQALVEAVHQGILPAEIVLLFCDKPQAPVLKKAECQQIKAITFSPQDFKNKEAYEEKVLAYLRTYQVELLVLAGYMRIIGTTLLEAYPNRIINIHPSLLPQFPGLKGIEDAFTAKAAQTGVTIHYVDQGVDTGPIIAQEAVMIEKQDTLATLTRKIHHLEHRLYPAVLADLIKKEKECSTACQKKEH
jgi:phosphoribosylglycinamide formyltransferase-1